MKLFRREALLTAAIFGFAGLISALIVLWFASPRGSLWNLYLLSSFLAGFLTSWFLATLIPARNAIRGIFLGLLVVLISYPFSEYLLIIFLHFMGLQDSFGRPTVHPLSFIAIKGALALSFFGFLFTFYITLPIGALAGLLLGLRNSRDFHKSN